MDKFICTSTGRALEVQQSSIVSRRYCTSQAQLSLRLHHSGCRQAVCRSPARQTEIVHPGARAAHLSADRGRFTMRARAYSGDLLATTLLRVNTATTSQTALHRPLLDLSEGLEAPVQLLYLLTLLGFLVVGAWLVVRQVLVRRELEEAAKVLGERTRGVDATSEDCFELGVILLRKKLFTQAVKNLDRARRSWNGLPDELAQVHNALGFAYYNMEKNDLAVENYRKAVELQPGYVTAWNNLGDAFERKQKWNDALRAYQEALSYAPANKVAKNRSDALKSRLQTSKS